MANENIGLNRRPIFYFNQSVAGGADIPTTLGGVAGTYTIYKAAGNARLLGLIQSAQAPATGYPRIRFWPSPSAASSVFTNVLTVDPNNANSYPVDYPLYTPYFSIEYTQGATPGNVFMDVWTLPESGAQPSISNPLYPVYTKDGVLTPLGYNQFTVDGTTAKGLGSGSSIPATAVYAVVQLDQGGTGVTCRYRDDGTSPTTTVGMPLIQGVSFTYEGTPLSAFSIIGTAAGPTTVNVLFYK